jgi:hypothetical protein
MLVASAALLGVTGCAPNVGVESGTTVTSSDAVTGSDEVTESDDVTGTTQVESNTGQVTQTNSVESTGPSESGAGAASEESQPEADVEEAEGSEQVAEMTEYVDSTYHFAVSYPSDFVLSNLSAEELSQLIPTPDASVTFMNPETATSDIVELEPADLEIRVYSAGEADSLESWLTVNGLLAEDGSVQPESFQTPSVSGLKVCASTMIFPGCSNFVLGNGFVYQLIPVTVEGEAMIETFTLAP